MKKNGTHSQKRLAQKRAAEQFRSTRIVFLMCYCVLVENKSDAFPRIWPTRIKPQSKRAREESSSFEKVFCKEWLQFVCVCV